jgi:hypothetical protein
LDPFLLEQTANYVNTQYPWATEDTAARIAQLSRSNNIKTTALAAALQKTLGLADSKQLETFIKEATNDVNKKQRDTKKFIQDTKRKTNALQRGIFNEQAGLEGITTLAHATSEALDHLANESTNVFNMFGRAGRIAQRFATAGTATMVAATSVASVFSRLIVEQEKQLRGLMDFGVVLGDLGNYTSIRTDLANLGMTMAQYNELLSGVQGLMTSNVSSGLIEGSGRMLDFLSSASTQRSIRHFGYTPAQASRALAQEAEHLFQVNQINELNEHSERRIVDSFQTVNEMALFLAEKLGVDRSALLEARRVARENVDYNRAMVQQREYLNEQFGEGTSQRVQEAYDWMAMLFPMLGQDFAAESLKIFGGTLADIQFDTSAVNNMLDQGFVERLQLMGPGVYSEYVNLMEDAVTGRIGSREEFISRFVPFVEMIKRSDPRISASESVIAANETIAAATLIPLNDLSSMTQDQIRDRISGVTGLVDGADDAIQGVGDMSRLFLQMQNRITPGYQSMGTMMGVLNSSVTGFTDFWTRLFGADISTTTPTPQTASRISQDLLGNALGIGSGASGAGSIPSGAPSGSGTPTQTPQQQVTALEGQLADVDQRLADVRGRMNLTGDAATQADNELLQSLRDDRTSATANIETETANLQQITTERTAKAEELATHNREYLEILGNTRNERDAARGALETARTNGVEAAELARLEERERTTQAAFEAAQQQAAPVFAEVTRLQQELEAIETRQRAAQTALRDAQTTLSEADRLLTSATQGAGGVSAFRIAQLRAQERDLATQRNAIEVNLTDARARLSASAAAGGELGSLSAQYESRGDYTTIGFDRTGGHSYGRYQIASNTGAMQNYLNFIRTRNPDLYNTLMAAGGDAAARRGDANFQSVWRSAMANEENSRTQHEFAREDYFNPVAADVSARTGLDVTQRSRALQDALWSTAIQHGAGGGAQRVFERAVAAAGGPNASDADIIRAIYAERGKRNRAGQLAYFSSSTAAVQSSVANRFVNEQRDALAMLEREQQALAQAQAQNPEPATVTPPTPASGNPWTIDDERAVEEARAFNARLGGGEFNMPGMTPGQRAYAQSRGYLSNQTAATPATPNLQSRQRELETQIQQLAGPDRLNTTTGEVDTSGLSNDQITRINSLERELQQILRDIAALQARTSN